MTNDALELSDKCETASSSARSMAEFVAHRVCPVVYLEVLKACALRGRRLQIHEIDLCTIRRTLYKLIPIDRSQAAACKHGVGAQVQPDCATSPR